MRLAESRALLQEALGEGDDIRHQSCRLRWDGRAALLVYIDGLCSSETLQGHVLRPLMAERPAGKPPRDLADLGQRLITVTEQRVLTDVTRVRDAIYSGNAALLVDGFAGALVLGTQGWEERPVQSPPSESALRGPRDGFIESISTNIALVRRRICDPTLRVRYFRVGARTRTRVVLLYLADLARPALVHELATRLAAVEFDGILDTAQLREFLVGQGFNPFPKMEMTERPDKVAAALLSGKVAVLVDNSPFAAVAPTTLIDFLWAPDDYYSNPAVALLVRLVRLIGWGATMLLSPLYIALQAYNPELVRSDMALFLARERLGVPLTAPLEIIFLAIMMELIFEATVRLPAKIGSAATVVGGLIIGQAAVQARIISSGVIIVVAISAIGSFTLPGQEMGQVWRAIKWLLIVAASTFGVYGLFALAFVLLSWLAAQDSFGTPFLAPLAPMIPGDLLQDFAYRKPWDAWRRRPATYRPQDPDRTGAAQARKFRDGGER